jgi:hypothetical protein
MLFDRLDVRDARMAGGVGRSAHALESARWHRTVSSR